MNDYWILLAPPLLLLLLLGFMTVFMLVYSFPKNKYTKEINMILENNTITPLEEQPELLNRRITDFYINTSHNTYLSTIQHLSIVSTDPIRDALQMGARCIELDISSLKSYPIVAHGTHQMITTSYISLKKALDTIVQYGFNTSDPLILCLEIFDTTDTNINNQVRDLLIQAFGDKIWSPKESFATVPISSLLGKIIIMGSYGADNVFEDIFDNTMGYIGSDVASYQDSTRFERVYRSDNTIRQVLSYNLDPHMFWDRKYNLVSMNFQMKDKNMYENVKFFKNSSFVFDQKLIQSEEVETL